MDDLKDWHERSGHGDLTFDAHDLETFSTLLMQRAGASLEEARLIAQHAVAALLSGEENHGHELGTNYIPAMRSGDLRPGAPMTLVTETSTTLVVDGNHNFGHVVSHRTMEMLIDKASAQHVAAASIRNQGHVGRLIDYTSMAARSGMIGLMMCNGAWGPKYMAPFGGTDRRLGVNPWSLTMPGPDGQPIGFDMTSGAVSLSKVRRARDEGRSIPEGWIINAEGRASSDPNDFYNGGSALPLGGAQAYKGYALTFMIEALADILSGMAFKPDPARGTPVIDGCFMAVFSVGAFRPLDEFTTDVAEYVAWIKSSPLAPGSAGVFYPGERSHLSTDRRRLAGVPMPRYIWDRILDYAAELGVSADVPESLPSTAS